MDIIDAGLLEKYLVEFLPRQRWFGDKDKTITSVAVDDLDALREEFPLLVRALTTVQFGDKSSARYQVLVGVRPDGEDAEFLRGSDHAMIGLFDAGPDEVPSYAYDALVDPDLGLALLPIVAPEEHATRVRLVGVEQSNTSLIYDDRIIMKVFRRVADGANPDVEVTNALAAQGFGHVAEPIASWREGGRDLAFVQRFLTGSVEGWALALTSLRDLYAETAPDDPSDAGGDFGAEARRLGEVTAELHIALAEAFGRSPGDAGEWAESMAVQLERVNHPDLDKGRIGALLDAVRSVPSAGPAIRVHGDYHLGQVLRADEGWFVLDFEGEPARPLEERQRPSSPMKDVAGMLRSFHYAASVAMREHDADVTGKACAWEDRNRQKFLDGYLAKAKSGGILPDDEASTQTVLAAFELDKAVYELAYEQGNRPEWVDIPLAAINRILEAAT